MKTPKLDVQYDRRLDIEGDENRGWQVDQIVAHVNGVECGYLKLAFIPKERFLSHFPSILYWMDKIKGNSIFPYADTENTPVADWYKKYDFNTLTDAQLVKSANSLSMCLLHTDISEHLGWGYDPATKTSRGYDYSVYPEDVTRERVRFIIDELTQIAIHKHGDAFKEFRLYHVDKPIDDFIRVDEEYQRNGVALGLYIQGVDWLSERGLPFYLSSLRSDGASRVGERMRELGMLRRCPSGRTRIHKRGTFNAK